MYSEPLPHSVPTKTRRAFLTDAFCGFGAVALTAMSRQARLEAAIATGLTPQAPLNPARAKSVIFLFMAGGPSQMETFDPVSYTHLTLPTSPKV